MSRKKHNKYDDFNADEIECNAEVFENEQQHIYGTDDYKFSDDNSYFNNVDSVRSKQEEQKVIISLPIIEKIGKNRATIEYNDCGLIINTDKNVGDIINIKVSGAIGSSDFAFEVI